MEDFCSDANIVPIVSPFLLSSMIKEFRIPEGHSSTDIDYYECKNEDAVQRVQGRLTSTHWCYLQNVI